MEFIKHDAKKLKRVGTAWRKPRGRKNKTKVGKRGHKPMPSKGFRTPVVSRNKISGLYPVRVLNTADLERVTSENIVIIASAVGRLKRNAIIQACKSKNLKVMNYERDAEDAEKTGK